MLLGFQICKKKLSKDDSGPILSVFSRQLLVLKNQSHILNAVISDVIDDTDRLIHNTLKAIRFSFQMKKELGLDLKQAKRYDKESKPDLIFKTPS